MKDFFKSFQKSFRRKKKEIPQKTRKESLAPTQVGGQGFNLLSPSNISNRNKSKTWSTNRHSPPPVRVTGMRGENHPGRRFTVTEGLRSAWTRGGHGGVCLVATERMLQSATGDLFTETLTGNSEWFGVD